MTKNVYFVRHGETDSNFDRVHRGSDSMLTEKGKEQAAIVGDRFVGMPIDVIVTSSFQRAIDTAEIIAERIKKPTIDRLESLVEYEYGPDTLGLPYEDERHRNAVRTQKERFISGDRYPSEETFSELQDRAREVLAYLENRPEENILVVSHGRFMRFLFCHICLGAAFTPEAFNNVDPTLKISNTGITHIQLKEDKIRDSKRWVVWQWNDSAHLG